MTRAEIQAFIEHMEQFGDIWTEEDVTRVYGDRSLEDALSDRMNDLHVWGNIIGTVLNSPQLMEGKDDKNP